ncbi:MAG: GNAT family N-acetyltransferase [Gemmataceae bacterium]|nr:GNAT family N-acetyltransferase [Gemmataceae bacterium]
MIRIRSMTPEDLALGLRLKEQAGWNQTEADWLRFLTAEPGGAFVAELDGQPAGTLATCVFGPVAWIAMVLVDSSLRRRGVARALMEHALAWLDESGVPTVRLDATPLGQPLYEQLGFVTEHVLTRFEGFAPPTEAPPGVRAARPQDREALLRLDREATGTDRARILLPLIDEQPDSVRVVERDGEILGFLMSRPGARARYVGPCIARAGAGPLLLADAWQSHAGEPVFIDVPLSNTHALGRAQAAGLTAQRPLTRMGRGPRVAEQVELLWASAGPEKG